MAECAWGLFDDRLRLGDRIDEIVPQTGPLLIVPRRGRLDVLRDLGQLAEAHDPVFLRRARISAIASWQSRGTDSPRSMRARRARTSSPTASSHSCSVWPFAESRLASSSR